MEERSMVICTHCQGTGVRRIETLVDHHKGEYEVTHSDCSVCEGTGRRVRILTDNLYPWRQGPSTSDLWGFDK
jgi:DnaJ-class molecular chaperone